MAVAVLDRCYVFIKLSLNIESHSLFFSRRLFTEVPLPVVERLEHLKGRGINDAKVRCNIMGCSAVYPTAHIISLDLAVQWLILI